MTNFCTQQLDLKHCMVAFLIRKESEAFFVLGSALLKRDSTHFSSNFHDYPFFLFASEIDFWKIAYVLLYMYCFKRSSLQVAHSCFKPYWGPRPPTDALMAILYKFFYFKTTMGMIIFAKKLISDRFEI